MVSYLCFSISFLGLYHFLCAFIICILSDLYHLIMVIILWEEDMA
jgi:hypothetical protein